MRDTDLLKKLKKEGWEEVSIKGSHYKLKKDNKTIIIPIHGKDIKKGLLNAILKQAGLK